MSPPTLDASHALPHRRWFPPTRTALDSLLTWLQQQDAPQVAVFDWDSTSIQGDIGGEFGRYQIATLQLRGTPDDFGHVWQAPVAALQAVAASGQMAASVSQVPQQVAAALGRARAAYTLLAEAGLVGPDMPVAARRAPAGPMQQAHKALATELTFAVRLAYTVGQSSVTGAVYASIARMSGGFTIAELRRMAGAFVAAQDSTTAATGPGAAQLRPARPLPEICDLMAALEQANTTVWVVTASPRWLVQEAAARWEYPVAPEHIVGVRLSGHEQGEEVRLQFEMASDAPVTFRAGKVEAIERYIGRAPALVAGDAMTDYEMMTNYPETAVRLLVCRKPLAPPLMAMAQSAWTRPEAPSFAKRSGPITLLQGCDGPDKSWNSAAPLG